MKLGELIDNGAERNGYTVDAFVARETAYSWHGGQWSPLYSFASTDCTVHSEQHRTDLLGDLRRCLDMAGGVDDESWGTCESEWLEQNGLTSEPASEKAKALVENLIAVVELLDAAGPDDE